MGTEVAGGAPPSGTMQWCEKLDASGSRVKHGPLTEWYRGGQKKASTRFSQGRPDGDLRFWSAKGALVFEGTFTDGKKTGKWRAWHFNGGKAGEGEYRDDQQVGHWTGWDDEGKKCVEYDTFAGKPDGKVLVWFQGELDAELEFRSGRLDGPYVSYWSDVRQPEKRGRFRDGKRVGLWQAWYPNGAKRAEADFGDGASASEKMKGWSESGDESGWVCANGISSERYCAMPTGDCCFEHAMWPEHGVPEFFLGGFSGEYRYSTGAQPPWPDGEEATK
jgi:antitoxin component YwqK of YwqJK toxin-antitoxin module